MKKILIAIAALSLALSSCDSFLEEKTKGRYVQDTFYANKAELELARTGLYYLFGHGALRSYESLEVRFSASDDNFGAHDSLLDCEVNAGYTGTLNNDVQQGWERCYNAINAANAIINKAHQATDCTEKEISQYIAEAKFVRAYFNFWLVKFFNSFPLIMDSYNPDSNREVRNSRPEEVYKLVIEDLEAAERDLPEKWEKALYADSGCFTKIMCKALLAKVYLQLAGYPVYGNIEGVVNGEADAYRKCASIAKEVIDLAPSKGIGLRNHYWEEFDSYWRPNTEPVEENIIWVDRNNEEDYSTRRPLIARNIDIEGWEGVSVEYSFFQKMPAGERRDFTFVTDINTKDGSSNFMSTRACHPRFRKFWADTTPGEPGWDWTKRDDPKSYWASAMETQLHWYGMTPDIILRYADILLTYAEAYSRANGGPDQLAKDCLKDVMNRAYKGVGSHEKDAEVDAIPAAEFADRVVEERLYEFCGNELTSTRWFDLVRLAKVEEVLNAKLPSFDDPATCDVILSYVMIGPGLSAMDLIKQVVASVAGPQVEAAVRAGVTAAVEQQVKAGIVEQISAMMPGFTLDMLNQYIALGDAAQVPGMGCSFAQLYQSQFDLYFNQFYPVELEKNMAEQIEKNRPHTLNEVLAMKSMLPADMQGMVDGMAGQLEQLKGFDRIRDWSKADYFYPIPNRDVQMNPALAGNNDYLNN